MHHGTTEYGRSGSGRPSRRRPQRPPAPWCSDDTDGRCGPRSISGRPGERHAAAFGRQAGLDPILLALVIIADVDVAEFGEAPRGDAGIQIGRAHVCTPVTNAHLVSR